MSTATIVIVLDLDAAFDCPRGTAIAADGASRDFHGWLGLASTIEVLVTATAGAIPPVTDEGDQT